MATTTRTKTFASGDVLTAADLNAEFNNLLNALALVNADIAAGAAIVYSKLSIADGDLTAAKVSGTAVTLSGAQTITGNKTYDAGTLRPADIVDSNGNELEKYSSTASAVNEVTHTNAATGNAPRMAATGNDANIHLDLRGKGNGLIKIAVLRQDDTTNAYTVNSVILTGWGYAASPASQTDNTETVTFGITFSEVPIIVISYIGGSSSAPTALSDLSTDAAGIIVYGAGVSVTTLNPRAVSVSIDGAAAPNLSTRVANWGYTWIAIGQFN